LYGIKTLRGSTWSGWLAVVANGRCSRFCASLRLEPDPSFWSLDYDDAVLEM
jgi:hypothetical protein